MSDRFKLLRLPADVIGSDRVDVSRRFEIAVEKCPESSVLGADPGGVVSGEQIGEKLLASLLR